jgi:sugar lactone lactonase YvrE
MTPIQFLAEWALRSSVLIASGALLLWALRVKDAAIRWAAWTAMLCASLAIPALTAALPRVPLVVMRAAPARVEAPVAVDDIPLQPMRVVPPSDVGRHRRSPSVSKGSEVPRAVSRPDVGTKMHVVTLSKPFDWARPVVTVYVLVALGLLLRLCFGLAMSLRLLRSSRATGEVTEGIEIRESDRVATPVTLGIVRSAIVLPGDWREWDRVKLDAVLAHERSHIRRHDPAVQLLSTIHRALLWHSPLSWFLHRRIVRAAEEASDDAALTVSQDRSFYAEVLLDFMQRGVRGARWQGVPMARYGRADKRIHRILDGTVLSRGVTRWSLAAILALGMPLACVVAAAHPQSAPVPLTAGRREIVRVLPQEAHPQSAPRTQAAPVQTARIPQALDTLPVKPSGQNADAVSVGEIPGGRLMASREAGVIATIAGGGSNGPAALLADVGPPISVAVDADGNTFFVGLDMNQVFKVDRGGNLTVVAGAGIAGYGGDGGPASDAKLNHPLGVAVDQKGNLFIADIMNRRVRRVDALTGIISTVAGNGQQRFGGDGGPASSAVVNPRSVAVDVDGNLFIGDGPRIRRVDAATGIITTVAGNGQSGSSGDGGPAVAASLGPFSGMAVDAHDDLFLAEITTGRVRRIDAVTGIITTVAGNGAAGFSGDGGPATSANLNWPTGLTVDARGNLFIGDSYNHRVRRVDAVTRIITTVAGNGQAAFSGDGGQATSSSLDPGGVAVDPRGDLLIADATNLRILRVDAATGKITVIAGGGSGGDGGAATQAILTAPSGVAADKFGNLFIASFNDRRIRRVDALTGIIATVAGNGTGGFTGDGGLATDARLTQPADVAVDAQGNLFIVEPIIGRVRRVDAATGIITTVAGGGSGGDGGLAVDARLGPQGVAVDAKGNIFIAESGSRSVRRVDAVTGIITTVAGGGVPRQNSDGGPATSAGLVAPWRVAVDAHDNLFIADSWGGRVRRVDALTGIITSVGAGLRGPQSVAVDPQGNAFIAENAGNRIIRVDSVTGITTTVAGNGDEGYSGDGGPAISASLGAPQAICVDGHGRLYIADTFNNRVRVVQLSPMGDSSR